MASAIEGIFLISGGRLARLYTASLHFFRITCLEDGLVCPKTKRQGE